MMVRARSSPNCMQRNLMMGSDADLIGRVLQRARCFFSTVGGSVQRQDADQERVDALTAGLALYEMPACPYCCMVRRRIRKLKLNIPVRDVYADDDAYNALVSATQRSQVPCLYIAEPGMEPRWLFESKDIMDWLEQRFGVSA